MVHSVLFLICLTVYWNSLECDFVFDDITAIVDNRDLRPHVPVKNLFANDFWGTPMSKEQSHKSYRPLTVLTFRWNYWLGQTDPVGYHLVNVLLHAAVTVLYYNVCRQLVSALVAFIAATLFALHPIHTEAVTGVVGRAELLASLFYLSAVLTYGKSSFYYKQWTRTRWKYLMVTLVCTTLAMLCKEQGITVVAVCIVYEVCVRQRLTPRDLLRQAKREWLCHAFQRICVLTGACICLLLARLRLMGSHLPVFTRFDNPAAVSDTPTRQLTYNYLAGVNAWLLLAPCDLICDWTMSTVPLVASWVDPRNAGTLLLYAALAGLARSAYYARTAKKSAILCMGVALTVFPFLPASNLFFPVGFVVAERVLYMPSMGFCLLVAYGWRRLYKRMAGRAAGQIGWAALLVLLLAVLTGKTVTRNWDWRTELTIFRSGLKVTQGTNAKLLNNVGHALEGKEDWGRALDYFHLAVKVQPDDIGAHINVGRVYNHLKRFKEAEEAYLKAKSLLPRSRPGESYQARVAPNHLNVFLNLATLIAQNGSRLEEADSLYRQAISMRADYTQAYINRGDILLRLNRTKEAREVYETALAFESDNPDLLYNMGVVLLSQGEAGQALAYLDKALEYDPDHYQALLNSAILMQESGAPHLRQAAADRLMKIERAGRSNERVYFNLAMLSMDAKNGAGAEHWFKKAVDLKPDFRSALFNLALLLSETDRPMEGAPFLHQLLQYYPDHVKGLILLGDLYVNQLGDLRQAEQCYRRILKVEPDNVQARHNLCVVMVEAGDLQNARECLKSAAEMAPNEDYIARHLHIVEEKLQQKLTGATAADSTT